MVISVFGIFLGGIIEFAHAYLVIHTLNAAAKRAARYGAAEGVSTTEVRDRVDELLGSTFRPSEATIYVKDAGVFDSAPFNPTAVDYTNLPDIELEDAEPTQLFAVRVSVPYNEIAIMPTTMWVKDLTLWGGAVMRHE
ncbi:MAG: hypothetical protein KDA80_18035 [Planctomycetaceae bacterium]|nr:hypothetical protein [Planctomycetaceae bacterium]